MYKICILSFLSREVDPPSCRVNRAATQTDVEPKLSRGWGRSHVGHGYSQRRGVGSFGSRRGFLGYFFSTLFGHLFPAPILFSYHKGSHARQTWYSSPSCCHLRKHHEYPPSYYVLFLGLSLSLFLLSLLLSLCVGCRLNEGLLMRDYMKGGRFLIRVRVVIPARTPLAENLAIFKPLQNRSQSNTADLLNSLAAYNII